MIASRQLVHAALTAIRTLVQQGQPPTLDAVVDGVRALIHTLGEPMTTVYAPRSGEVIDLERYNTQWERLYADVALLYEEIYAHVARTAQLSELIVAKQAALALTAKQQAQWLVALSIDDHAVEQIVERFATNAQLDFTIGADGLPKTTAEISYTEGYATLPVDGVDAVVVPLSDATITGTPLTGTERAVAGSHVSALLAGQSAWVTQVVGGGGGAAYQLDIRWPSPRVCSRLLCTLTHPQVVELSYLTPAGWEPYAADGEGEITTSGLRITLTRMTGIPVGGQFLYTFGIKLLCTLQQGYQMQAAVVAQPIPLGTTTATTTTTRPVTTRDVLIVVNNYGGMYEPLRPGESEVARMAYAVDALSRALDNTEWNRAALAVTALDDDSNFYFTTVQDFTTNRTALLAAIADLADVPVIGTMNAHLYTGIIRGITEIAAKSSAEQRDVLVLSTIEGYAADPPFDDPNDATDAASAAIAARVGILPMLLIEDTDTTITATLSVLAASHESGAWVQVSGPVTTAVGTDIIAAEGLPVITTTISNLLELTRGTVSTTAYASEGRCVAAVLTARQTCPSGTSVAFQGELAWGDGATKCFQFVPGERVSLTSTTRTVRALPYTSSVRYGMPISSATIAGNVTRTLLAPGNGIFLGDGQWEVSSYEYDWTYEPAHLPGPRDWDALPNGVTLRDTTWWYSDCMDAGSLRFDTLNTFALSPGMNYRFLLHLYCEEPFTHTATSAPTGVDLADIPIALYGVGGASAVRLASVYINDAPIAVATDGMRWAFRAGWNTIAVYLYCPPLRAGATESTVLTELVRPIRLGVSLTPTAYLGMQPSATAYDTNPDGTPRRVITATRAYPSRLLPVSEFDIRYNTPLYFPYRYAADVLDGATTITLPRLPSGARISAYYDALTQNTTAPSTLTVTATLATTNPTVRPRLHEYTVTLY